MSCLVVAAVLAQVGEPVPEPTLEDQGIRITRDYVAEFVALAPMGEEKDRAWPLYLEARRALKNMSEAVADMPKPGDAAWGEAREFVKARRAAIALLWEAAEKPVLGYPLSTRVDPAMAELDGVEVDTSPVERPPEVFSLLMPYLGVLRASARSLWADVMVAIEERDAERFWKSVEAMLGVARHASEHPNVIGDLVSLTAAGVAMNAIEHMLATDPSLTDTEGARLVMAALRSAPMRGSVRPRMAYDRLLLLDVLQRSYSDDGNGDGRLRSHGLRYIDELGGAPTPDKSIFENPMAATTVLMKAARRREVIEEFDRLVAPERWHMPLWEMEQWPELAPTVGEERDTWRKKYLVLGILGPMIGKAAIASEQFLQRREAARAAIAVELHRQATGRFPEDLSELVPAFLDRVPEDRFTGEPLLYRVVDGKAVVYSRGPDLDDDGGRRNEDAGKPACWQLPKAKAKDRKPVPEGDWVLFTVGAG